MRVDVSPKARRPLGVAALIAGLFATWVGFDIGGETATRYVDDLMTVSAALVATILCLRAAARDAQPLIEHLDGARVQTAGALAIGIKGRRGRRAS